MIAKSLATAGALLLVSVAAQAQTPAARPQLRSGGLHHLQGSACHAARGAQDAGDLLAEHASRYHGVTHSRTAAGAQVAYLVRGGCTLAPDAYLFTVIDRAIIAEMSKLPKRQ